MAADLWAKAFGESGTESFSSEGSSFPLIHSSSLKSENFLSESQIWATGQFTGKQHIIILWKNNLVAANNKKKTPTTTKESPSSMREQCHNLEDSNLCKTRIPRGFIFCTLRGLKLWVKLNSKRLKFSSRCRKIRTRPRQLRWRFAPRT